MTVSCPFCVLLGLPERDWPAKMRAMVDAARSFDLVVEAVCRRCWSSEIPEVFGRWGNDQLELRGLPRRAEFDAPEPESSN